jgi:hypothetical protein
MALSKGFLIVLAFCLVACDTIKKNEDQIAQIAGEGASEVVKDAINKDAQNVESQEH